MKDAIETAKSMTSSILVARLGLEGEYTQRLRPVMDGYGASPAERFADNLATRVFARLLNEEQDIIKRRALYLANVGWLCGRPGLRYLFPREVSVLKEYSGELHPERSARQRDLLSKPVRDVLQCEKDFTENICP